jgi:flagellar hook-associated protein 1 FlgK
MSLSSALSIAMSGLSANQVGLSIVSSNVANASTPGFASESVNLVEQGAGGVGTGVQVAGINRALDTFVQSQLRTETSGDGFADQTSSVLQQLQNVYGTPGGQGTLETAFSNLTTAVQGLQANSGAASAQSAIVTAAQNMAQVLNSTTQGIQGLRTNVQQDIATSVSSANADMTQIANLNTQLQGLSPTDPSAATLEDQRDTAINQLAQLMGINVTTGAGVDAVVQRPFDAGRLESLQHQPDPERCRHHHADKPEWRDGRYERDQLHHFRPDRG